MTTRQHRLIPGDELTGAQCEHINACLKACAGYDPKALRAFVDDAMTSYRLLGRTCPSCWSAPNAKHSTTCTLAPLLKQAGGEVGG